MKVLTAVRSCRTPGRRSAASVSITICSQLVSRWATSSAWLLKPESRHPSHTTPNIFCGNLFVTTH